MKVNFAWDANPEAEVIGYKIYAGRASGVYDDVNSPKDCGDVLTGFYDISEFGTWFFALTAYTVGSESDFSAEIQHLLNAPVALFR